MKKLNIRVSILLGYIAAICLMLFSFSACKSDEEFYGFYYEIKNGYYDITEGNFPDGIDFLYVFSENKGLPVKNVDLSFSTVNSKEINVVIAEGIERVCLGSSYGPKLKISLPSTFIGFIEKDMGGGGDWSIFTDMSRSGIEVAPNNPYYFSSGNCLIERESKTLILGCASSIIPDDGSVTSIGDHAFNGCGDLSAVLEVGETFNKVFVSDKCVFIPKNITKFGRWAFANCASLRELTIPDQITGDADYLLNYANSITKIKIGKGITSLSSIQMVEEAYFAETSGWVLYSRYDDRPPIPVPEEDLSDPIKAADYVTMTKFGTSWHPYTELVRNADVSGE